MCTVNYIEIAKRAKAAARDCINSARRERRSNHFTHRGIEVLAIDENGERIGDPLDYLEVSTLSGKQLANVVKHHAPGQYSYICVQGGIDFHESAHDAMQYPDDYEPMYDTWEVDAKPERSEAAPAAHPGEQQPTGQIGQIKLYF